MPQMWYTRWTSWMCALRNLNTGCFFYWSALKNAKCQITCKSLQKSSKCQKGLALSHFKDGPVKKTPCIFPTLSNISMISTG